MRIEYLESSGWVERDFTIKGSSEDVAKVRSMLSTWLRDNGLDE